MHCRAGGGTGAGGLACKVIGAFRMRRGTELTASVPKFEMQPLSEMH